MKGTFCARTTSSSTLWLLNYFHLVCQLAPLFGHTSHAGFGLIRDRNCAGHGGCLSIALYVGDRGLENVSEGRGWGNCSECLTMFGRGAGDNGG